MAASGKSGSVGKQSVAWHLRHQRVRWMYDVGNRRKTESVIDLEALPKGIPTGDPSEPCFFVGMDVPPDIQNVTALNARGHDYRPGFMTFTLEPIEECFQRFFEADYASLYKCFRWI